MQKSPDYPTTLKQAAVARLAAGESVAAITTNYALYACDETRESRGVPRLLVSIGWPFGFCAKRGKIARPLGIA